MIVVAVFVSPAFGAGDQHLGSVSALRRVAAMLAELTGM